LGRRFIPKPREKRHLTERTIRLKKHRINRQGRRQHPEWMSHHDLNWNFEEMELLRTKYGKIPTKVLSKMLHRSKYAIRLKAHRMNITTGKTPDNFKAHVAAQKKAMEEKTKKMLEERDNELKTETS